MYVIEPTFPDGAFAVVIVADGARSICKVYYGERAQELCQRWVDRRS